MAGALVWAATVTGAGPAGAADVAVPVRIEAGPLEPALQELARQTNVEILYDRDVLSGRRSGTVRGRLTQEAAFARLLEGSSLTVRRMGGGVLVVEAPNPAPLARQDVTVPELLVVGRRTQNADIRRLETDIQPYRVATGLQILRADRDNLEQYFRGRVPTNAQVIPPSLNIGGETVSEIDLRGLGSSGTLVLLDGRRLPAIPATLFGFRQPDLNALPLHAVGRVEVLTGAAGGIYGFGALGGVVNVVMDRGDRGADLYATGGLTSRGRRR